MRDARTRDETSRHARVPAPRFDDLGHGLRVGADENIEQCAVYFDTPDLRLTRSGASLRYRSDDGWTVKLPAPAEGAKLVRTEITFPGDRTTPPAGRHSTSSTAWIRTAPVDEVAEVRTSRHRLVLNNARGTKIAEIDDDRVTTSNRTGSRHEFREVEVELTERAPERLDRQLAKHVKNAGSTKASSLSKVARGSTSARSFLPRTRRRRSTLGSIPTRPCSISYAPRSGPRCSDCWRTTR